MKTVLFFFLLSFAILSRANSQTQFPQNYEAFYQKAINQINPIYVKGIKANAIKIKDKNVSVVDIKSMISQDKTFNNIQNEDIEINSSSCDDAGRKRCTRRTKRNFEQNKSYE